MKYNLESITASLIEIKYCLKKSNLYFNKYNENLIIEQKINNIFWVKSILTIIYIKNINLTFVFNSWNSN